MKKIIFISIVLLTLTHSVFSQSENKSVTIQSSPFLFFSDIFYDSDTTVFTMDMECQVKITGYVNVGLVTSILVDNRTYSDSPDKNKIQMNFQPMFIHRPFGTGIGGFYLGFYPNIGFQSITNNDDNPTFFEIGFGFNLGYKWVFGSGFTMQLGSGIGRTFSFPENNAQTVFMNSDGRITFGNTDIHFVDFKLGYSF